MKWTWALLLLLLASPGQAQEWVFDIDRAIHLASESDRLLVVVQFDNDFLATAEGTAELSNFCHHSIDESASEWISSHFLFAAQNVGRPDNLIFKSNVPAATERAESSIGNSITWICRPSGSVLFCLPGYPDADNLLKVLEAVRQLKATAALDSDSVVRWHRQSLEPEDFEFYESFLPSRFRGIAGSPTGQANEKPTIAESIQAVAEARRRRLLQRFGANWDNARIDSFLGSLSGFAAFEGQFLHCLFALHPDLSLRQLQKPIWQHLAATRCWAGDREKIVAWVHSQREAKRPLLVRVVDPGLASRTWPPPRPQQLPELISEFAVLEVSLDELAITIDHLKAEPFSIPSRQKPAFLVATSQGDHCHLLTNRASSTELAATLVPIFEREEYRR